MVVSRIVLGCIMDLVVWPSYIVNPVLSIILIIRSSSTKLCDVYSRTKWLHIVIEFCFETLMLSFVFLLAHGVQMDYVSESRRVYFSLSL